MGTYQKAREKLQQKNANQELIEQNQQLEKDKLDLQDMQMKMFLERQEEKEKLLAQLRELTDQNEAPSRQNTKYRGASMAVDVQEYDDGSVDDLTGAVLLAGEDGP